MSEKDSEEKRQKNAREKEKKEEENMYIEWKEKDGAREEKRVV